MRDRARGRSLVVLSVAILACSPGGTEPSRARLAVDRPTLSLFHGRADTVKATAYDARGQVSDVPIRWTSAHPNVAVVDSLGVIVGNAPGRTTITASAPPLTATVEVTVLPDTGRPQIAAVELSSRTVDLSGGDAALVVRVRARDTDSGIRYIEVAALHPTAPSNVLLNHYCPVHRESGSATDGAWVCTIALHHHAAPGTWRVAVSAYDWRPWPPNWDSTSVAFTVINPRVDDTPPTLDELTFTQERITHASLGESRLMSVTAHDDGSGVLTAEYFLDSDSTPGVYGCGAERPARTVFPWQPVRTVSGTCPVPLVASDAPVYRSISLVRLTDARGNRRELNRDELARAGIVTRIDIRR
jgi:hypothetical protein